jgi:hypothetical protein
MDRPGAIKRCKRTILIAALRMDFRILVARRIAGHSLRLLQRLVRCRPITLSVTQDRVAGQALNVIGGRLTIFSLGIGCSPKLHQTQAEQRMDA